MDPIGLIALLTYTFGAFAFGALLVFALREYWLGRAVGYGSCTTAVTGRVATVATVIHLLSLTWFLVGIVLQVAEIMGTSAPFWVRVARLIMTFLYPPLIMQVVYAESQSTAPGWRHPLWRVVPALAWIVSLTIVVASLLAIGDVFVVGSALIQDAINYGLLVLFAAAAIYGGAAMQVDRPRDESGRERSARLGMTATFGVMGLFILLIVVAAVTRAGWYRAIDPITTSMPLLFIVVAMYHESRYRFFDLFVKRGLALLSTAVGLTVIFGLVLPRTDALEPAWLRPWALATLLLPLMLVAPWLYGRVGSWLDNRWLGRRYAPIDAVKHFLAEMQSATDEPELVARAERGLSRVFSAPSRIRLDLAAAPSAGFEQAIDVPVRSGETPVGAILMGRRHNDMPWFSQDIALLESLADVFGYMLENVRLQQRKQEQDQVARELTLQASRSELKALRAQINPHFLFNALNAIAGLIHDDPARADRTVEQLAEVFRYTLRRSDSEHTRLEDELEFVRAYLEVERARFGERLSYRIDADPATLRLRVPTMVLQTLVENAVKHGVSREPGAGRIEIHVRLDKDRLLLGVADSGPGFPADLPRVTERAEVGGFGLHNVRRRLEGQFGDRARLVVGRDAVRGMTVVQVELPLDALDDQAGGPTREAAQ